MVASSPYWAHFPVPCLTMRPVSTLGSGRKCTQAFCLGNMQPLQTRQEETILSLRLSVLLSQCSFYMPLLWSLTTVRSSDAFNRKRQATAPAVHLVNASDPSRSFEERDTGMVQWVEVLSQNSSLLRTSECD